MSEFITKLKKLTKSAINKTSEDDVETIFGSHIEGWRDDMEDRAKNGYNHYCIWKFNVDEDVFFLKDDRYDISKDRDDQPIGEVIRFCTSGQFFNSKAFKEWILDSFPDCKLHYDSVDCENYYIRLSW
jgi:hypothetical protein